ncbi:MAG: phage replisome organizer N-terminal domain-containing protein [Clostridia bacterium]|nr:phage replisome organizer N-terminal domain-containing protein [Clostridia bacterium]
MYDIQWFKLEKNIFCNRKIQLLLGLNDGDTYFRIWIQLLSLAVECGDGGRLIIGNNPISIKEFSKIMGKSSKKMSKILEKFLELEMLKKEEQVFAIKSWNKYQSLDRQEDYLIKNRERQRRFSEKMKKEQEKTNVSLTLDNATEEKREEKITKEKRKEENIREEENNGFRKYKL